MKKALLLAIGVPCAIIAVGFFCYGFKGICGLFIHDSPRVKGELIILLLVIYGIVLLFGLPAYFLLKGAFKRQPAQNASTTMRQYDVVVATKDISHSVKRSTSGVILEMLADGYVIVEFFDGQNNTLDDGMNIVNLRDLSPAGQEKEGDLE